MSTNNAAHELDVGPALAAGLTLSEACERAEGGLVSAAPTVVQEALASDDGSSVEPVGRDRLQSGDTVYEIRVGANVQDPASLQVVIGVLGGHWTPGDGSRSSVAIEGVGQYSNVVVECDQRLASRVDLAAEDLAQFFTVGYRKLRENVKRELLLTDMRVAIRLYAEVRGVLSEAAASNVWLYAILNEDRAVYLLDPTVVTTILERAAANRAAVDASPLALTILLASGWVKADETAAVHVLKHDEPIAVKVADMYYPTTPEFNVAEKTLYGEKAHVQPLVRDGKVRLVAAYPPDLRDDVELKLWALRRRFAEILQEHQRATKKLFARESRESQSRWDFYLARLMGSFFGGYVSPSP
jgi:hypothetical protein